jgi:hypothetical protein
MKYTCPRCNYTTDSNSSIKDHILNKKKLCKLKNLDVEPSKYKEIILNGNVSISDYIKLNEKLDKLSEKLNNLVINGNHNRVDNSTDNSINDNSTTNNINIVINNYNEPNLDYIGEKHYRKYMKDFKTAYLNMCREIYFNPKHPENNSLKKPNKRDKFISYYKDGKWKNGNVDTIIPEIKELIYEAFDKGSIDDKLNELTYEMENNEKFKVKVDTDIIAECNSWCS